MPKPKPLALDAALLDEEQITPQAATAPRSVAEAPAEPPAPPAEPVVPLQIRIPRSAVREIKHAAVERDMTISDLLLEAWKAFSTQA